MRIEIAADSKVPIYIQIEEQVRSMIAAGQLQPGDQLPTIRELAADLRVNYNTVARAYLDLDRDGVITTQRGRGTFVAGVPDEAEMARMREETLRTIVQSSLDEARRFGYGPKEVAAIVRQELGRWLLDNGHLYEED
jgi:GntR family transcriptional regulator